VLAVIESLGRRGKVLSSRVWRRMCRDEFMSGAAVAKAKKTHVE
jgi:hypothetical protein